MRKPMVNISSLFYSCKQKNIYWGKKKVQLVIQYIMCCSALGWGIFMLSQWPMILNILHKRNFIQKKVKESSK